VRRTAGTGEKGVRVLAKEGSQTEGGGMTATTTTVSIATGSAGVMKNCPAMEQSAARVSGVPAGPVRARAKATLPLASLEPFGPTAPSTDPVMASPVAGTPWSWRLHEMPGAGMAAEPAATVHSGVDGSGKNWRRRAEAGDGVL
jgi:hypothetical protein